MGNGTRLLAAALLMGTVAASAIKDCPNWVRCPCGDAVTTVTICPKENVTEDPCKPYESCLNCTGNSCVLECHKDSNNSACNSADSPRALRHKRQARYFTRRRQQFLNYMTNSGCRNLDSPKLGSIRCRTSNSERVCVGTCLPGYNFETLEEASEIVLTCHPGGWEPFSSFPPCKSEGHCNLLVQGHGSFNCTTSVTGTWCDVFCSNRWAGHYFCYPGRPWEPPLPPCVRPKEFPNEVRQPACVCEYGASCDSNGNCVCPVGRTGLRCESIVPEKAVCRDPGFVANGQRRNSDGSEAATRRRFQDGETLIFSCDRTGDALQGASYIVCADGRWSGPRPKCIRAVAEISCPDPGQVANADRLNSDGRPAQGTQRYRPGDSVAYTCRPGYALQRRSLLTCQPSGSWSDPLPNCTPIRATPTPARVTPSALPSTYCRDPGTPANGSRQPVSAPSRRGFPPGSFLEFSCGWSFELEGERKLFCLRSGRWSADPPTCKEPSRNVDRAEYCLNPGSFQNGQVVYYPNINSRRGSPDTLDDPEYPVGARLQYSCDPRYSLVGDSTLVCLGTGSWSTGPPSCRRESRPTAITNCYAPNPVPNGDIDYIQPLNARQQPPDLEVLEYPEGVQLKYSCRRGHSLRGSSTLTCLPSGQWSEEPPVCERDSSQQELMYCERLEKILDGSVEVMLPQGVSAIDADHPQEYPEGTRLIYSCEQDYTLLGASEIVCQSSGQWSANPPICSTECGVSFMQTSRRILHGATTRAGEWPWVVAIAGPVQNVMQVVCGGAVVNSRTVVTAAHCLEDNSNYTLYFGKLYRSVSKDDTQVMVRQSVRIIRHRDFVNSTFDSDIGLVIFSPRIRFTERVQPICLPTADSTARNLMTGKTGFVTGWGVTETDLPAEQLLLAQLPFVSSSECMGSYRRQMLPLPITQNMFCAGFQDGSKSACTGDSGSPICFHDRIEGRYHLEGLVSFGAPGQCGQPGRYTVFTKVFPFSDWILKNLA